MLLNQLVMQKNKLIFVLCSILLSRGTYAASSHEAGLYGGAQISIEAVPSKRSKNKYTTLSGEEVELNPADYPRLYFDYENKQIYLEEIVDEYMVKSPVLDYSNPNGYSIFRMRINGESQEKSFNESFNELFNDSLDAIRFYFRLLEKKLISSENIHNLCRDCEIGSLNHNGEFFSFDSPDKPLTEPMLLNFNNNPHNSLLVEFFCNKAMGELGIYLELKTDLVLPIIKEYIDRVPDIFPVSLLASKKLLLHDPVLFLSNLTKFCGKDFYGRAYSIFKNAASKFKDNPDNLKEIVNEAISELALKEIIL